MTESTLESLANGTGFSAGSGASGGFDAGEGWDSHYDLRKAGVNAVGDIPMPSQTKIDNYQRKLAALYIELDSAESQQQKAQRMLNEEDTSEKSPEELLKLFDEAKALEKEVYDKFRDALAEVCSNKPTRKQLAGLNQPTLIRFMNFVGDLLNPNV